MLSPTRLSQLLMEVVFLLLGALVVWLAALHRISVDRHSVGWLVLSFALVAWGLLALAKPGQIGGKWHKWNRAGSLILLGLLMFAISRAPFDWVVKLLAVAGFLLIVRGLLGSFLILRQP